MSAGATAKNEGSVRLTFCLVTTVRVSYCGRRTEEAATKPTVPRLFFQESEYA